MHPDRLSQAVTAYDALKQDLIAATGLDADDECLADTLEGETDLTEIIVRAIREARRSEAMAKATKTLMDDLTSRKKRFEAASDRIREVVARAMERVKIPTIRTPDLTIVPTTVREKINVFDAELLPLWARTTETVVVVKPNWDAINEAYQKAPGEFSCPGIEIIPPRPNITVKGK